MLIPYKYMYIVGLSWFVLSRSTSYCPEWYHITVWYYPEYTELLPCIVCSKHLWNASSFKFLQVPSSSFKSFKFLQVPSSSFKFLQVPSSSFKFLQPVVGPNWGVMSIPSNLRAGAAPHYLPSIVSFPDPTTFPPAVECEEYCVGDSYVCVCLCMCMCQGSHQAFSRWFWTIWMCQI